jgi:hypothetical protein
VRPLYEVRTQGRDHPASRMERSCRYWLYAISDLISAFPRKLGRLQTFRLSMELAFKRAYFGASKQSGSGFMKNAIRIMPTGVLYIALATQLQTTTVLPDGYIAAAKIETKSAINPSRAREADEGIDPSTGLPWGTKAPQGGLAVRKQASGSKKSSPSYIGETEKNLRKSSIGGNSGGGHHK